MASWTGRVVVFDVETTGVDVENDRIIQAFVGLMGENGEWIEQREWLIDPGIEIPEAASDVHGYTTERIQKEGRVDWQICIGEIESTLLAFTDAGSPLVMFNGSFDLSILTAEMRRSGYVWDLWEAFKSEGVPILDPYVVDKQRDKYRKGSRKLVDVAPVYGVPVEENAHDAGADCLMTGRIAMKMLQEYSGEWGDLVSKQVEWAKEQRSSLQAYFARTGKTNDDGTPIVIDTGWPLYDALKDRG